MGRQRILLSHRTGFEAYIDAFEELGCEVLIGDEHVFRDELAGVLIYMTNLYSAAKRPLHALHVHRRLRLAGIPAIAWDRDAPWHMGRHVRRLRFLAWIRPLDIYASHTMQPTYDFAPHKVYCPNAVWVRHFNLHGRTLREMRAPAFFRWDVSFVGNMDGARYPEHAARQSFFAALRPRLEMLGLRVFFCSSGGMDDQKQIEVIQRSIINLNYRSSCDHRSRAGIEGSWGLPERCYGVPARGGFILSDQRRHAQDDFDLASEWADYSDMEDCIARIGEFLADFPRTRRIAEAAHKRVMRDHTYERRAERLLNAAANWRAKIAPGSL